MGPVTGILREVTGVVRSGSPITKRLEGVDLQFLGQTQSLSFDAPQAQSIGMTVSPLIEASKDFWGETDYRGGEASPVFFDPRKDHSAPLPVAVSVEKGAFTDRRVSVDTARMVVVGNGDFLKDNALTEAGLDFALSSFNWLLSREELIGIAPKEKKNFTFDLRDEDLARIIIVVMGAIPGLVAICGVAVWWQRRR